MPYSEEARDKALRSGGVPLDAHPDDPGGILHAFANSKGSVLELLWNRQPDSLSELIETYCSAARSEAWAREEVRALVYKLVLEDKEIPSKMREVIALRELRTICGPRGKRASDIRLLHSIDALQQEGLTDKEVNRIFRKHGRDGKPRDHKTLRIRLERARGWINRESDRQDEAKVGCSYSNDGASDRRIRTACNMGGDPGTLARDLLEAYNDRSLLLPWDTEPDRHDQFVRFWVERAQSEPHAWDAVRRLVDELIRGHEDVPKRLVRAVMRPRPRSNCGSRRLDRNVTWYSIFHTLERLGHRNSRKILYDVISDPELNANTFNEALSQGRKFVEERPLPRDSTKKFDIQYHAATDATWGDISKCPVDAQVDWTGRIIFYCGVPSATLFEELPGDSRLWMRWGGDRYEGGGGARIEFAIEGPAEPGDASLTTIARTGLLGSRAWILFALAGVRALVDVLFVEKQVVANVPPRYAHWLGCIEDPYYLPSLILDGRKESITRGEMGPRKEPRADGAGMS